jgi:predicted metal-dependent hydrolase
MPLWSEEPDRPPLRLRHSLRARRVAVRISAAGQVELVIPSGVSERRARAFLDSRAEWVRTHLARRHTKAMQPQAFPPPRLSLPLLGEDWLLFMAGGTGRMRLVAANGRLELRGIGTPEQIRSVLLRWLRQRAVQALSERLTLLAAEHGFTFGHCQVRTQRSRWGSCSTRGVISLNVALLFQPAAVVRYLLCHELAHTRHMNHSARFWQCVEACEPAYRALDAELTRGWQRVPAWIRSGT